MPEWGNLPIPQKLLKAGIRDMVRISDARMSGTSYGACVLHVSPESFVGGPLALLKEGDIIELDVAARQLNMRVNEEELRRRRAAWRPKGVFIRADTASYSCSTSSRLTRDATSTFWRVPLPSLNPRFTEDPSLMPRRGRNASLLQLSRAALDATRDLLPQRRASECRRGRDSPPSTTVQR